MRHAADQGIQVALPVGGMRPRRWYTEEIAPPKRYGVTLTTRLWRYCALVRAKRSGTVAMRGSLPKRVRRYSRPHKT